MNFSIFTLGCKVNAYESEGISGMLCRHGLKAAGPAADPDLVIINTCTVTGRAAQKSKQLIRKLRKKYPHAEISVIGCHTAVNREELLSMPETDHVPEYSGKYSPEALLGKHTFSASGAFPFSVSGIEGRTRGLVMVQDGCNASCSYCILPKVRGPLKSRALKDIIEETKKQAEQGCAEIVITGIHTGAYGRDLKGSSISLSDVIEKMLSLEYQFRIRLSSIEVNEISDPLIALMKSSSRFCPHFPIPIQSGSNRILGLMNRPYTKEQFHEKIMKVRSCLPDCAVTTDIICGFPGETEEDFSETLETVSKIGFSRIHAFSYSKRPGTPAAEMKEQIPGPARKRRVQRLIALGRKLSREYALTLTGGVLTVIPETIEQDGLLSGYCEYYVPVYFKGPSKLKGSPVQVLALDEHASKGALTGKIQSS